MTTIDLWHQRLGHRGGQAIKNTLANYGINVKEEHMSPCRTCELTKMTRQSFLKRRRRAERPLQLVHGDLIFMPIGIGGFIYLLLLTDDYSRFTIGYLLKTKDEALTKFKEYIALTENHWRHKGYTLRAIQYDNGTEIIKGAFHDLCRTKGIVEQQSLPHCPEQNGLAERHNGITKAIELSIRTHSGLPRRFWTFAIQHAILTKNICTTVALNKGETPYELWHERPAEINLMKTFGCEAIVHIPEVNRTTGGPKAKRMIHLGVSTSHKGWTFLNPDTWRIEIAGKATFHESTFPARTAQEQHHNHPVAVNQEDAPHDADHKDLIANTDSTQASTDPNYNPANEHYTDPHETARQAPRQQTTPRRSARENRGVPPAKPGFNTIDVYKPINDDARGDTSLARPEEVPTGGPSDIHIDDDAIVEEEPSNRAPTTTDEPDPNERPIMDLGNQDPNKSINPEAASTPLHDQGDRPDTHANTPTNAEFGHSAEIETFIALAADIDGNTHDPDRPDTIRQALDGPDREHWLKAIQTEVSQHKRMQSYRKCHRPKHGRILQTRWVFTIKRDEDGKICRYKARWVAKGYLQKAGIDYDQTYAAVMRIQTSRAIIAYALAHDLKLTQADIVTAYLNGDMDREIYVQLPEGFGEGNQGTYARLQKALYGTKQAGRLWWRTFTQELLRLNFTQSRSDPCLFYKLDKDSSPIIVGIYVDDMEIAAMPESKDELIRELSKKFDVKDLGAMKHLLGMKIHQDEYSVHISQPALIDKLKALCGLQDASSRNIPMQPGVDLTKEMGPTSPEEVERMAKTPYRNAIGILLYIALGTRPDIMFAVTKLSQFCANPGSTHWSAVKYLIRYLIGTREWGIQYTKSGSTSLLGYSDADHATDKDDRKSFSGTLIMYGNAPITWKSQKQKCVTLSTMESELVALTTTITELLFWDHLLKEMPDHRLNDPTTVFGDNQSSLAYIANQGSIGRAKHIALRHCFIKDELAKGSIQTRYIPTNANIADIFTKALPLIKFRQLRAGLKIVPIGAPVQGSVEDKQR